MSRYSELDEIPNYGLSDVSRYLRLPLEKTRRWNKALLGHDHDLFPISFANLLELHVLKSLRVEHELPLQRIRKALSVLKADFPSAHPLLDREFHKYGLDLLMKNEEVFVNLNRKKQIMLREMVEAYADRIDNSGANLRYFPFTSDVDLARPKLVVLDPAISFGRPVLVGTGISTEIIAGRFRAGDSMQ
ncbi:MAG: DUF433 domain-containing protein, partial [Terriglobus sp.]